MQYIVNNRNIKSNNMATFLFTLSNIAIPFALMIYNTAIQTKKSGQYGSGQWFCLILYTFISNFLFYLAKDSKLYLFGDLFIKLIICFLPHPTNSLIEQNIKNLHLQLVFERIRKNIIAQFLEFHQFLVVLAFSKMNPEEKRELRDRMIEQLRKIQGQEVINQPSYQHEDRYPKFGNPTSQMDHDIHQLSDRQKYSACDTNMKTIHEVTEEQSGIIRSKPILMKNNMNSFGVGNQGHLYDHKIIQQQTNIPTKQRQQKIEKPVTFGDEPSEILKKVDLSEYSDMFCEGSQFEKTSNKMITRIQAIVEIGSGPSVRLEIYNIQLYENDDIKIKSLYGREFESHKLIAITRQTNGYYELQVKGGNVSKRRVKFRGNIEPFHKFMNL